MLDFKFKKSEETQPEDTNQTPEQDATAPIPEPEPTQALEPTPTPIAETITQKTKPKSTKANIFIVISIFIILCAGALGYMVLNSKDFPFVAKLFSSIDLPIIPGQPEEPVQPTQPQPEPTEPVEPTIDSNEIVEYISDNFEFSIKHRAKARVLEPGSFNVQLETYQVIYDGAGQDTQITGPENVTDGYLFSLTVHKDIINRDIDDIAVEKRNRYLVSCDDTAIISNVAERTIANRTAKTFKVENCGVNYIQSFFIRGNDLFEFNQVYRGDIGVRQVYESETNEIVELFKIINTIQPTPIDTWSVYETTGFRFRHPTALDATCCTLRGPISDKIAKRIVLADPKSLEGSDGTLFNGFAVYTEVLTGGVTKEIYIENQRKLLAENYRVIIGKNPVTSEETLNVGGKVATYLKGYAWWGNMLFMDGVKTGEIIVFVTTEIDPGAFDPTFREILNTFEYTN